MKIVQKESVKSWCNNHLHQVYWHSMPRWMQFCLFIRRGLFNGFVTTRYSRLFCWFGFHKWGIHKYMIVEKQKETNKFIQQCSRCCMESKIYTV